MYSVSWSVLFVVVIAASVHVGNADIGDGCICTLEYMPLCGSDGQTYSNRCNWNCEKKIKPDLTIACEKECPCDSPQNTKENEVGVDGRCICPKLWKPVCGSDGITYGNECEFRCAQRQNPSITIVREGTCD